MCITVDIDQFIKVKYIKCATESTIYFNTITYFNDGRLFRSEYVLKELFNMINLEEINVWFMRKISNGNYLPSNNIFCKWINLRNIKYIYNMNSWNI